jgi:hypothetical protein
MGRLVAFRAVLGTLALAFLALVLLLLVLFGACGN